MELKQLQAEYDSLNKNLSDAKDALKKFETKLSKTGAFVEKGKIQQDEKMWAASWDVDYYSHFDGHTSDPIYKYYTGSVKLDKDETAGIQKFLEKWEKAKTNQEKINALSEFEHFPYRCPYEITGEFENFSEVDDGVCKPAKAREFTFKDDTIMFHKRRGIKIVTKKDSFKLEVINKDQDQGECAEGSYIEFKKATKSEIAKNPVKEKESRG